MWNFDAKKILDKYKEDLKQCKEEIQKLNNSLIAVEKSISELNVKIKDTPQNQLSGRLEDLEIWRAKIHNLLIEKTPATNQDKIKKSFNFMRGRI